VAPIAGAALPLTDLFGVEGILCAIAVLYRPLRVILSLFVNAVTVPRASIASWLQSQCSALRVAVVFTVFATAPVSVGAEPPISLAGRSNQELLEIIRAGRTDRDEYLLPKKQTALPPDFWTLPPREAALALIRTNCSEETKQRVSFSIPDPLSKQAPAAGEVGIRWKGTGSGPMGGGLTILRAAGEKSQLAYSAVDSKARPHRSRSERR